MPNISFTKIFNVSLPSIELEKEDKIYFKFVSNTPGITDYTASLSPGQLTISSLTPSIGYAVADCPFLYTGSESNEVILDGDITNFHDNGYIFTPNPVNSSLPQSSLYPTYGNVDYPFVIKPYDLFLLYLNDGTYLEYTILELINGTGTLRLKLNQSLPQNAKTAINGNTFSNFLILTKIVDETNAYIIYNKRPGRTSYGFIIPDNLSPEVLANIDTITKEVKQKLLNEQQTVEVNSIDTLNGGGF
jgi:cold shock CspA family protein